MFNSIDFTRFGRFYFVDYSIKVNVGCAYFCFGNEFDDIAGFFEGQGSFKLMRPGISSGGDDDFAVGIVVRIWSGAWLDFSFALGLDWFLEFVSGLVLGIRYAPLY